VSRPGSDLPCPQRDDQKDNGASNKQQPEARPLPARSATNDLRPTASADVRANRDMCLTVRAYQSLHDPRLAVGRPMQEEIRAISPPQL